MEAVDRVGNRRSRMRAAVTLLALTPTLGNRSRRCSTSCIHAVVSRREREKEDVYYFATGSVSYLELIF